MEKTKQKQEALERMKMLKLHHNVIKEFEKDGIVNLSESGGFLYWLNGDEQTIVDEFETEYDALVYHVIHDFTEFGELYSLLYVSKDEDEWKYDREDIENGIAIAYVKNTTEENFSEFGSIGIRPNIGGLVRTA